MRSPRPPSRPSRAAASRSSACTAWARTRPGTGPNSRPRTARTACCACRPPCTGRTAARSCTTSARSPGPGLPIMVYNNPIDTKVDLTPDLIAELGADRERRGGEGVLRRRPARAGDPGRRTAPHRGGGRGRRGAGEPADGRDGLVRRLPERVPRRVRATCSSWRRLGKLERGARALRTPRRRRSAGTRAPSSCRPSSYGWTSSAASAGRAVRRAGPCRRPSSPSSTPT